MNKKIMLVGGGTGGHVTPLLAVAERLVKKGIGPQNIYLITDKDSAKKDYLLGHRINVLTISGGKFSRFITFSNLLAPFLIFWGFIESMYLLLRIWPSSIFAKGAYLSFPFVLAAWLLRFKIYLHESDSVMGMTNRRLFPLVKNIFVSFPRDVYPQNLQNKIIFSGLPIRESFFRIEKSPIGDEKIVIMGGSQGAQKINYMISQNLSKYLDKFELFHICGEKHFDMFKKIKSELSPNKQEKYHLYGFLGEEIVKTVAMADLVVSRAGATSLFEVAALKRPMLLIPYSISAGNHQLRNAEIFEMAGASEVLHETKISDDDLFDKISKLMEHGSKRYEMAKKIEKFSSENAAEIIVDYLIKNNF